MLTEFLAADEAVTTTVTAATTAPGQRARPAASWIRVRLHRAQPRAFAWDKPPAVSRVDVTDPAEVLRIAADEAELAGRFNREKQPYDRFLDPAKVPPAEGTREACGRRSVR